MHLKCSSCGLEKSDISPKNSRLLPKNRLLLCTDCLNMEPRYLIVLFGRTYGIEAIRDYIVKKRYHGKEILAKELL